MGNLCGKESSQDNFSQPGRTLSAPPPSNTTTAPLPKKIGGPPRTLGGSSASKSPQTTAQQEDARKKAAEAAEVGRKLRAYGPTPNPLENLTGMLAVNRTKAYNLKT